MTEKCLTVYNLNRIRVSVTKIFMDVLKAERTLEYLYSIPLLFLFNTTTYFEENNLA